MFEIKRFLGLEPLKFPLQKNLLGYYPALHTEGGELRCPLCSGTSWAINSHTLIGCKTCLHLFEYYGSYGLKQIEK